MSLTPENLDKVMAELVAVSRSAMSKREEAANLARIWGRVGGEPGTDGPAALTQAAEFRAAATALPTRRRARWRRVA